MMQAYPVPQTAGKTPQPGAKPMVQRKVKLGSENDPLEHEADRAAAEILSGARVSNLSRSTSLAQRKCSACEDEERHAIRRKCAHCEANDAMLRRKGGAAAEQSAVDRAASAISSGGTALTAQQRAYFEPRFGHNFSEVRLHRSAAAERAAEGIGARAYTLGSSIAFASAEGGNALLAHELAHVVQQSGRTIRRQPAGLAPIDTSGGGGTAFLNTVTGGPTLQADGTFTGSVRRQEISPATATQAQMTISDETVNVIYDPKNCVVRLPFRMNFVAAPTSGTAGICTSGGAGPAPPVSPARLAEIANEVVQTAQDGLNSWFKLRVSGCKNPCAGRDIPIRVEVSQTATSPDVTINVVNRGGRADAATICAPDFNPGTTVHEGGHQRLGVGDEYRETNQAYRTRTPAWARDERVRTDFTRMGSQHTYGRLAAFHERHFQFAQVFVQAALGASCKVDLARARALPVEARFTLGGGGFSGNLGEGYAVEGGVDAALPLDTSRRFNLEAGLHALYLNAPEKHRDALLFGARLGLSAQTHPATWGAKVGVFGGVGGIVWPDKTPYGEVGARIGIFDDMKKGRRIGVEVEAALGKAFSDDTDKLHFARIGLNFVYSR